MMELAFGAGSVPCKQRHTMSIEMIFCHVVTIVAYERRIYFGLAPVRFGCCGCAAYLATVETKTPRLSATVASEAHLGSVAIS